MESVPIIIQDIVEINSLAQDGAHPANQDLDFKIFLCLYKCSSWPETQNKPVSQSPNTKPTQGSVFISLFLLTPNKVAPVNKIVLTFIFLVLYIFIL